MYNGTPGQSFPVDNDSVSEGTISLPPNEDFWYTCMVLCDPGVTLGYAYFRYFKKEDGEDVLEAVVEAPKHWEKHGKIGFKSATDSQGGFNLQVEFDSH